jgi:hypothetical protein
MTCYVLHRESGITVVHHRRASRRDSPSNPFLMFLLRDQNRPWRFLVRQISTGEPAFANGWLSGRTSPGWHPSAASSSAEQCHTKLCSPSRWSGWRHSTRSDDLPSMRLPFIKGRGHFRVGADVVSAQGAESSGCHVGPSARQQIDIAMPRAVGISSGSATAGYQSLCIARTEAARSLPVGAAAQHSSFAS